MNSVTLEAWIGLGNLCLNKHWRLNAKKLSICIKKLCVIILLEPDALLANKISWNSYLIVSLIVHEIEGLTVVVEILHLFGKQKYVLKLGARITGLINNAARTKIANLIADKRTALTWLYVLELNDGIVLIVNLKAKAVLEICGTDSCHV